LYIKRADKKKRNKKKVTERRSNFSLIKSQDNIIQAKFQAMLKEVHLFIIHIKDNILKRQISTL